MQAALSEFELVRAAAGSANENGRGVLARRARSTRVVQRPLPRPSRIDGRSSEIAILDGRGMIVAVNAAWRQAAAARGAEGDGVGEPYVHAAARIFPELDTQALARGLGRLLAGSLQDVRQTSALTTAAGPSLRHLQVTPLATGGPGRFVAIHDDQTELAVTRQALKATSEQLLCAQEDERRRIAMELHDSTCQHLAAISLGLARLRRVSPGVDGAVLDEISGFLDEASRETRALAYLMNPRGVEPHGLSTTVLKFLDGFARRTGLEVSLDAGGAVDGVSPPLQHAALRIVQEALLNANRHARASRVAVELKVDGDRLKVAITDDGCGMEPDSGEPCLGVGIPGMRARAQQVLGDLMISSDGTGTRVVALLPLA